MKHLLPGLRVMASCRLFILAYNSELAKILCCILEDDGYLYTHRTINPAKAG